MEQSTSRYQRFITHNIYYKNLENLDLKNNICGLPNHNWSVNRTLPLAVKSPHSTVPNHFRAQAGPHPFFTLSFSLHTFVHAAHSSRIQLSKVYLKFKMPPSFPCSVKSFVVYSTFLWMFMSLFTPQHLEHSALNSTHLWICLPPPLSTRL